MSFGNDPEPFVDVCSDCAWTEAWGCERDKSAATLFGLLFGLFHDPEGGGMWTPVCELYDEPWASRLCACCSLPWANILLGNAERDRERDCARQSIVMRERDRLAARQSISIGLTLARMAPSTFPRLTQAQANCSSHSGTRRPSTCPCAVLVALLPARMACWSDSNAKPMWRHVAG